MAVFRPFFLQGALIVSTVKEIDLHSVRAEEPMHAGRLACNPAIRAGISPGDSNWRILHKGCMTRAAQDERSGPGRNLSAGQLAAPQFDRWGRLRSAVRRALDFLNSVETTADPVHPDFHVVEEGWYWNRIRQPAREPAFKVRFFFNQSDIPLLDHCEAPCKFADNCDPSKPFAYCGFAYPTSRISIEQLEIWASRFPSADVFTYGAHLWGGRWQCGEPVREIRRKSSAE